MGDFLFVLFIIIAFLIVGFCLVKTTHKKKNADCYGDLPHSFRFCLSRACSVFW